MFETKGLWGKSVMDTQSTMIAHVVFPLKKLASYNNNHESIYSKVAAGNNPVDNSLWQLHWIYYGAFLVTKSIHENLH